MVKNDSIISSFETSVFTKDYKKAYNDLIHLLTEIDPTGLHLTKNNLFDNQEDSQINATRIVSCCIHLLSDKKFKLNKMKYLQLLNHKKNIDSLFRVSGFHTNKSALNFFVKQYTKTSNNNSKESNLHKMLIFMSLADHNKESLDLLLKIDKSITLPYVLAVLSSSVIFQENENDAREKLLEYGKHLSTESIEYVNTGLLAITWMHTSYAKKQNKHYFKGYLNQIMNNTLVNDGFLNPKLEKIDRCKRRPKILVLAEVFFSHHAMSRCYSNYIIQLKREFEVVLFCAADTVDEDAAILFDSYFAFDQSQNSIHQISKLISQQKPDIIFYPSIGMATWVIALLSIRFAPLQIAATGHPATTMSKTIDYLIAPEFLLEYEDCYSENLVTLPNALDNTHISIDRNSYPEIKIKKASKSIKIAINGKSSKINTELLSICEIVSAKIKSESNISIEWVFFTNETSFLHYHCQYEINKRLENASVIKSQTYKDYLVDLNDCDIALSPFPFGGSNSNIDLLRLAIPLVYLTGKEAHSRTDEFYFRNFNLTESLACNDTDEVIRNLIRLIEDEGHRIQIIESILKANTDSLLITEGILEKSDVLDSFLWLWKNHSQNPNDNTKKISHKNITSS